MLVNGKTAKSAATASSFTRMVTNLKEIGWTTKPPVMESSLTVTVMCTMVNGSEISATDGDAFFPIQRVALSKDFSRRDEKMDQGHFYCQMETISRENGVKVL